MLSIFKSAWPGFYRNQTAEEARAAVNIWSDALAEYPAEAVMPAARRLIKTSTFPPSIADVCKQLDGLRGEDDAAERVWAQVLEAISDSLYHARERFEALPPAAQAFVGSASNLRSMGMMDENMIQTTTRSQFLRMYPAMQERERLRADMTKDALARLTGGRALPVNDAPALLED